MARQQLVDFMILSSDDERADPSSTSRARGVSSPWMPIRQKKGEGAANKKGQRRTVSERVNNSKTRLGQASSSTASNRNSKQTSLEDWTNVKKTNIPVPVEDNENQLYDVRMDDDDQSEHVARRSASPDPRPSSSESVSRKRRAYGQVKTFDLAVRQRPKGRFWFHHVQAPPSHTDLAKDDMARQTSLINYFHKEKERRSAQKANKAVKRGWSPISEVESIASPTHSEDSDFHLEESESSFSQPSSEVDGVASSAPGSPDSSESEDLIPLSPPSKKAKVQTSIGGGKLKTPISSKRGKHASDQALANDPYSYKMGPQLALPPLSDIRDIFDDMTQKAVDTGLMKAVSHLSGRKLRIATMCSGTESPVLALDLVVDSLKKRFDATLEFEHVFSAEIVPYKQAYIDRNFSPPVIFRDVREMITGKNATSAYGAKVPVPGEVDVLVAGWSCVDFSLLNVNKQELNSVGESGDTFRAVLNYAKRWRPTLIVLENVFTAPWDTIRNIWDEDAEYHAEFIKLDSKQYYIPQTRQRGYMVCIDKAKLQSKGNPAQEWRRVMDELKRPASCSIESFMLSDDDPRVHRARDELTRSSRGDDKAPREVDWTTCQGRHQDYRNNLALGWKRPLTQWEDNGTCRMPDYAWADWAQRQVERVWDTIDMSSIRNARRGFDSQYKTRYWDLSQNIDRFQDTTPAGLAGCITPSGQPFVTYRGGPMIGHESLALQGIPLDKILLTRESQRQLQDLAGNAMTSTVAGAGVLAALIVGFKALKPGTGIDQERDNDRIKEVEEHISGEESLVETRANLSQVPVLLLSEVRKKAAQSVQLCFCEGSASIANREIQRCKDCHQTTCVKCGGIPAHNYEVIPKDTLGPRLDPAAFEDWLKTGLPMRVELSGISLQSFENLKRERNLDVETSIWKLFTSQLPKALEAELRFHSVNRTRVWTAYYDSPVSRMELTISGESVEWRFYVKVPKSEPGNSRMRSLFNQAIARMRPAESNLTQGRWELCIPTIRHFALDIVGEGDMRPSWESNLGLQEPNFAENKVWTSLRVSTSASDVTLLDRDITGVFDLLPDCGTASGSLHKKREDTGELPLYLFLDPDRLLAPWEDPFIFSTDNRRLNYGEIRPVVARLDGSWRPPSKNGDRQKVPKATGKIDGCWVPCPGACMSLVECEDSSSFKVAPDDMHIEVSSESCSTSNAVLHAQIRLPGNSMRDEKLGMRLGQWMEVDKPNERRVLSAFAWLTERLRKISGLDVWKELKYPESLIQCQLCAPKTPRMKWKIQKNKLLPYEDPEEAGPHERALKHRPPPFVTQIRLDKDETQLFRIGLNITTLIHRAAASLGCDSATSVSWRLDTQYVPSSKFTLPKFDLPSNKQDPEADQPPSIKLPLRREQRRSLHWMIEQENNISSPFMEEEVEEAILPQLGWRAEGRAAKPSLIQGGVLADQVGYGKTAISLGLHAVQAKKQGPLEDVQGKIPLKATLVVVPPQLTKQWQSEISRFFGTKFQALVITNPKQLITLSIREMQRADIIVVNWNLFSNETYLSKLADFAAIPDVPSSEGRAFDTWFSYAEGRVAEHVETLKNAGAKHLHEELLAKLASFAGDTQLSEYVPSKRLRGKAYRDAQLAKGAKGPGKGRKRSRDDDDDSDSDVEVTTIKSHDPTQLQRLRKDPFNLRRAERDWTLAQSPLFPMFKFNRLVVDEYTYAKDRNHTSITHIDANYRWVLSGTPPLGDFADVKTISIFLGINLGIDDDALGVLKTSNMKKMQRERTAAEAFQAFKEVRSPAWHTNRHRVAQRFLDQFVRQNIAEIDEIPFKEELRPIRLSAAERAIYIELHQHLLSQDMKIRKGKSKGDSDRERRLMELIGDSASPEEALVKKCSHFHLEDFDINVADPTQACNIIVERRRKQYKDLTRELGKDLKCAVWLKNHCRERDSHFQNWMSNTRQNVNGDTQVTAELSKLIDDAHQDHSSKDWKLFFTRDASAAASNKAKQKAKKKSSSSKKRKSDIDDMDIDDVDIDLSDDERELLPATVEDKIKKLRLMTVHLRRLATELVLRQRSLRFMELVRKLQMSNLRQVADSSVACSKCEKTADEDLRIFIVCGHGVCQSCTETYQDNGGHCIIDGCTASVFDHQIVQARELNGLDQRKPGDEHLGGKLEAMMNLLVREVPKEDQVLLFVQFDDLMDKVSSALELYGVSHAIMRTKARLAENVISEFQNNTGPNRKKVLILNIADESAAGANLTNANHVIFLSPLLSETQYQYDSSMAQAIGRARRYGQRKVVHVYHFLSLKTIDVDILEQRSSKRLVENADHQPSSFALKTVTRSEYEELESWGAGRVRRQYQFDTD